MIAFLYRGALAEGDIQLVRPLHSIDATVDGALIYAIGDVHGRYDLLLDLLRQIADDAMVRLAGRRPILIFCGDYIDRGLDSAKVMATLLWLQRNSCFETHFLMGNHEAALLDFLDNPESAPAWLRYGGVETLKSYKVRPPASGGGRLETIRARDEFLDRLPASHLRLLRTMELIITIDGVAFTHAGIKPGIPLDEQKRDDLLWIRDEFLEWKGRFDKLIVHGHTWNNDQVEISEGRIGIDTGAYETSVLSAIRMEDHHVAIFQSSLSLVSPT